MKNNNKRFPFRIKRPVILTVVLTAAIAVLGCTGTAQTGSGNGEPLNTGAENANPGTVNAEPVHVGAGPAGYNGPFQGEAIGKGPVVFEKKDDVEASIEGASLGRVFLKYRGGNDGKDSEIELPAEAMEHLNAFFKKRLKYTIEKNNEKNPTANSETQRDIELMGIARRAKNQFMDVEIDAPDGRRKISNAEAIDLIRFVTLTTLDEVE